MTQRRRARRLGQRRHAEDRRTRWPSRAKCRGVVAVSPGDSRLARRSRPAIRIGTRSSSANRPSISTCASGNSPRGAHVHRAGCARREQGRGHRQNRRRRSSSARTDPVGADRPRSSNVPFLIIGVLQVQRACRSWAATRTTSSSCRTPAR